MHVQERQELKIAARWSEKPGNDIPCRNQQDVMKTIVWQVYTEPAAFCLNA